MPAPSRDPEDNAKYFSVFFRPWTLLREQTRLPHLGDVGISATDASKELSKRKRSFVQSWEEYKNGNVVSETAAQLIRSIVTKTLACKAQPDGEMSEADGSDVDNEIAPLTIEAHRLNQLLMRSRQEDLDDEALTQCPRRRSRADSHHQQALKIVDTLWSTSNSAQQAAASVVESGLMHADKVREHISAKKILKDQMDNQTPYSAKIVTSSGLVRCNFS